MGENDELRTIIGLHERRTYKLSAMAMKFDARFLVSWVATKIYLNFLIPYGLQKRLHPETTGQSPLSLMCIEPRQQYPNYYKTVTNIYSDGFNHERSLASQHCNKTARQ